MELPLRERDQQYLRQSQMVLAGHQGVCGWFASRPLSVGFPSSLSVEAWEARVKNVPLQQAPRTGRSRLRIGPGTPDRGVLQFRGSEEV